MRDSEFDDAEAPTLWTVPNERTKSRKGKTDRVYLVPLPKLAQRIIKGMPRNDDGMLFPSRVKDKPMRPGRSLQDKIRKATGISDYAFHPCRDTVATWLKDKGHSTYERAIVLNHSEGGVTADYSVRGYPIELKRELLEKWSSHVEELVQPEGAALLR